MNEISRSGRSNTEFRLVQLFDNVHKTRLFLSTEIQVIINQTYI
jgi:hypothetical protein